LSRQKKLAEAHAELKPRRATQEPGAAAGAGASALVAVGWLRAQ